jgi:nitrile hydratase subunit beta
MNGVHDMGGMHGFGPIVRETNEPLFHADWEARLWAIDRNVLQQGYFTIDAHRYGIERMEPAHYLRASYYERWLASLEYNLIHEGILADDELLARIELLRRHPDSPIRQDAIPAPPTPRGQPKSPPPPAPRFAVGDSVVARNIHPVGHTRLPRYARGKHGTIHWLHGSQVFPDTNAHGLGENPQPLYTVRFEARELWGEFAEPREAVYLDLWDSYLDPVPS